MAGFINAAFSAVTEKKQKEHTYILRVSERSKSQSRDKSQLIFSSLVGNFFLVLSVVINIFSHFAASCLTPFTPSVEV